MFATGSWTEIKDEKVLDKALAVCKGHYQRNVVLGHEPLSGSTLRGKAKEWSASYARSRRNLINRMLDSGITVGIRIAERGKKVLVLG